MVVQPATVRDVLQRMQRDPKTHVDYSLAREIATREGIKAVIDGSLLGVGGRYVIAMRLVSAQTGEELASFRETADNQSELLPTVDRLAKEVRAKIGESLKKIQSAPPLEQVTTSSLEALKKYVQGQKLINEEGDFVRGAALLEEAVAIDTGFAMAYRKLGVENGNRDLREKAESYYEKAFAHRDRLSDAERLLLLGSYYQRGRNQDGAKSMAAYEQLIELQPNNTAALNNLSSALLDLHQYVRAESLLTRAIKVGPVAPVHFENLARSQTLQGKLDTAQATFDRCIERFPRNVNCQGYRILFEWSRGRYDSMRVQMARLESKITDPSTMSRAVSYESDAARLFGKLRESKRLSDRSIDLYEQIGGSKGSLLYKAMNEAYLAAWYYGDSTGAVRIMDDGLARDPIGKLSMSEAPYTGIVDLYAMAGRPDRARSVMAEWEARRRTTPSPK
jgi:tetratricopeptide (TPR) repeat protein